MGPDSEEGKGNKNMPGRPLRSPISVLFVPFLRVKTLFHDMREETPMVFLSGDWPFFIFFGVRLPFLRGHSSQTW